MTVLRSDIERALDDMISNEEGMRFQALAVVLAKQRWPEFIACERKKDLGADAIARASLTADRTGKVLACSLTATLEKIKSDATKIRHNFPDITVLIFATPRRVTNTTAEEWAKEIREHCGYELVVMTREDIISSLLTNAPLCQAHLGIPVVIEAAMTELLQKVRAATSEVIATWSRRLAGNPFIELRAIKISPDGRDTNEAFHLSDVRLSLAQSGRVIIEAPAGRGKTTTLSHLASEHGSSGALAFVVDLPGWIKTKKHILEFIAGMLPFRSREIDANALARLATTEQFSFFLNGWNEIAESDSAQAVEALRELDRDFLSAGILVATRAHRITPSQLMPGAVRMRLLPFDRAQRSAYLSKRLGSRCPELIARLDSNLVLNDLTRTPLILSQVAGLFEADLPIPTTKVGVIEGAMSLLEHTPEHSSHLQLAPLSGRAKDYLIALAVAATERGGVETAEEEARSIVGSVSVSLQKAGQMTTLPDQSEVLDALCKYHVLERVEYPAISFRFANQQFQEFYAALFVKSTLRELLDGAAGTDGHQFTKRFINEPGWSEAFKMVAAELGNTEVLAANSMTISKSSRMLVEMALVTDCVFAAELFRLCNVPAGSPCGAVLNQRLRFLYELPDYHFRQYALAGMLESGSDLFRDIIVPLLTNSDQQVRLGAYRLLDGIYVSSLGPTWQATVGGWKEDARADFFSELLHFGGAAHAILPFALADSSPKVHAVAISALDWIGFHDDLALALKTVDDPTFETAVNHLSPEDIPTENRPRAVIGYETRYRSSADPVTRLQILLKLRELGEASLEPRFKEELNKCDPEKLGVSWQAVIKTVLEIVRNSDPEWVSHWVTDRIAGGVFWTDDWRVLVTAVPRDLKDKLLHRLENEDFKHARHPGFMDLLTASGDSEMVERVFTKLCALRRIIDQEPTQRHEFEWAIEGQLEELFRGLPAPVTVTGLSTRLSRDVEPNELVVVARLFGGIGREDFDVRSSLRDDLRQALRTYLMKGVAVVLTDESFGSRHIGNLISALAKVGEPEDLVTLQALIRMDILRTRRAREAAARARAARQRHPASEDCSPWNIRAVILLDPDSADTVFLDLLREPEYERVAATALLKLASTEKVETGFGGKKDYKEVWEARQRQRPIGFNETRRKRYSEALADRITTLLGEWATAEQPGLYEFRFKELTKVLAELDALGSTPLILRVLSIPERVASWSWKSLETLETLLFNGVVLPAGETLKWFDATLERVRPHRYDNQQIGLLLQALCLLPFIDAPAVGIATLRETIADFKLVDHQLRGIALALGHSRCNEALDLLRELVAGDTDAKKLGDEWINAVAAFDSAESRGLLMSFVDPGSPGLATDVTFERVDVLAVRLLEMARRDANIEQRLFQLCNQSLSVRKRSLLSKVIGYIDTPDAVLAGLNLIDDDCTPPIPYEVSQKIEAVFVEHRPTGQNSNAYTVAPRSSNLIRSRILELATHDARRKKSALSLLGQIELWRLQYGRPHGEPRNPALGSRFPWPPIDMGN